MNNDKNKFEPGDAGIILEEYVYERTNSSSIFKKGSEFETVSNNNGILTVRFNSSRDLFLIKENSAEKK